jgi:6-phosphogluconolactonase
MTEKSTPYGRLIVGAPTELFARAAALLEAQRARCAPGNFLWALTGGSTPKDWYRWCAAEKALSAGLLGAAHWTVSDERCVPVAGEESNFGNADRLLLTPLGVPLAHKHPWPVDELAPAAAAADYARRIANLAGAGKTYAGCFLGLGPDAHTASLFPGSPLLADDGGRLFAAADVPGKGWRLTITPAGLRACGVIVVMALGETKAPALRRVLAGPHEPRRNPAQILKTCADRVVWLADAAAAAGLGGS